MSRMIGLASVAALVLAPGARAQCSCATNQVTNSTAGQFMSAALSGNTVCVANGAGWRHQEWPPGGPAGRIEIADNKGPGDPGDPPTALGTWTISGTDASSSVTYSYSGGSTGIYAVCSLKSQPGVGDAIGFCPGSNSPATIAAAIEAGASGCQ